MREPVGRVPLLGYDRVQQEQAKVALLAKVTGGRDRETFTLALTCHFVSIFPRVFEYAVCLFLVPFVLSSCTVPAQETGCCDIVHSHTFNCSVKLCLCSSRLVFHLCYRFCLAQVREKRSRTFMVAELFAETQPWPRNKLISVWGSLKESPTNYRNSCNEYQQGTNQPTKHFNQSIKKCVFSAVRLIRGRASDWWNQRV